MYYVWGCLWVSVITNCCCCVDSQFSTRICFDDKLAYGREGLVAVCSSRRWRSQLLCGSASLHVFSRRVDEFSHGVGQLLVSKRPSGALWMRQRYRVFRWWWTHDRFRLRVTYLLWPHWPEKPPGRPRARSADQPMMKPILVVHEPTIEFAAPMGGYATAINVRILYL